ncbi:MAG: gliding motility-associated C-terminal domain-containing protein, partial [Sphingobacteriales bacterium]
PNGAMPKLTASGLTPGSTIWVRFWEYGGDNPGTFGICATIPPPPPANDNPCGAITLVANENCTYATYTTEAATGTTGVPAPGCASYAGGDVWFKVVVPCTGSLIVDTEEGQITDGGMALYSGASCTGPLTLLACDDDGSGNGAMPRIVQTGLTPGSTVWIRVWEYGGDNPGTFGICVKIPTPPGPGGTCSTALAFCSSNVYSFPNTTGQPSLGGNGIYGCLGSTPNPTWYYMQVQTSGNITIGITQVDANGDELDVDFALWGPFNTLAGSCGGLTAANNISCSFSPSYTETAQINNAQAGQFYILLLTNYSDDPGTITFQQTGGTGSTNCNLVCNVTAANSGPVCPRALFNLTSSTVPNGVYSWTGPNCFTSNQQNPTGVVAPSTPGTYVYTVSVTGPNGVSCVSTTTVTVLQGPALGADSTVTRCAGSSLNLTTLYTTTGNTTAWTIGGQPVANPAAVTVGGVYQLVATNTIGCTDTALVTFRLDTVRAVATPANGTCTTNGTITISDTVGIRPFTFSISTSPTVFQSSPVFNAAPAAYTITVRDSLGCTASVPVTVGFNNTLFIFGRPDTTICPGGSAVLTTTSNATSYSWSPTTGLSNPAIASPVATPTVTTRYILTAGLGVCTRTDTVNINVVSSVNVNAGPDITILNGDAINLNATTTGPVTNILWSPATGLSATNILNPLANPTATTQYTITVNDAIGCTDSDDLLITVINNCIKVKNAFTPNGDGNNDLWQVYDNFGCLRNVTVHIYNRYGNRVYESRDYRNQWDGTYQGKPVPDATYYAVIDFTLITGRVLTVKSDVTILR